MKATLPILAACWLTHIGLPAALQAREWNDSTGHYTIEADLVAFNDKTVVLKRGDHELGALPIEKLSEQDREYLKSKEAGEVVKKNAEGVQTLTLRNGTKLVGLAVDFARRDVVIQRRRGNIYVDNRRLESLPAFYQQLTPEIVAHFEELPIANRRSLEDWVLRQRGQPRAFKVEGIVLETENGDEYGVPFFLLSEQDVKLLKPGWDQWLVAQREQNYVEQEDLAFLLRSLLEARQQDKLVQREIAMMQLKLQAVMAGLTSLWEVTLHPPAGHGGPSRWVVVPGRDSRQATMNALEQNPGFFVGPIRRVSGR